jgi:hypothetical protein
MTTSTMHELLVRIAGYPGLAGRVTVWEDGGTGMQRETTSPSPART